MGFGPESKLFVPQDQCNHLGYILAASALMHYSDFRQWVWLDLTHLQGRRPFAR
jgi:hypothetical protein